MTTVPDENIDAHAAELAASPSCDEEDSTDEFLQPPIEGVAAQLAERLHSQHCRKLGLCVKCGCDLRGSEEKCPEWVVGQFDLSAKTAIVA